MGAFFLVVETLNIYPGYAWQVKRAKKRLHVGLHVAKHLDQHVDHV